MKRAIFGLMLWALVLLSLTMVPAAGAGLPAQEGGRDDPDAPLPVVDASVARVHGSEAPDGKIRTAAQVEEYWTAERKEAAQPRPYQAAPGEAAGLREPLVQANGPAGYVNGISIGGTETGAVSGVLGGASTQTPSLTYPFPFTRTGLNIPIWRRAVGKLYVTNDVFGGDFYCSAAVITSGNTNYDLVLTEASCLHAGNNDESGWSYNISFCPATSYGGEPYGCWTDEFKYVPDPWYLSANPRYDYGILDTLDTSNLVCNDNLADCVGANGIAWNQPSFQEFWSMGYPYAGFVPAGDVLYFCTGSLARLSTIAGSGPQPLGMGCDLPDAYGGPWIISGKVANKGYVNSVFSFKINPNDFYGPYFDSGFFSLWDAAT